MMKKTLLLLSIIYTSCAADFSSSTDTIWNYHFNSYTKSGGILEENRATPLYTVDSNILNTMINSLPESHKADISHPEYFPSSAWYDHRD